MKICTVCKQQKADNHFHQIIKRKTYGIDCDDDGYVHYLKITKTCFNCRERVAFQRNKMKEKIVIEIAH
jgi:uncharacterized OB-fold protein